ncbi:His-Xaa-Ser system radical SAM maturase HxsB [Oryzomonas rubra]|uniref:His-Xaa-Ser system radical SAM maturase HxsB n=1 Tax=Oryzomonas rubra TaxID=2509454 RepID=A0A5A9XPR5_9BACT|nr:His-Xaa-Ser system radical SAM maturase HxsB [Oryzomonas rubra]KAA0894238.1 His-Xaa-Ser system radical SAM maturase HxsB [Oryzomonas rubra]
MNKQQQILPFQFSRFDHGNYLLVNESGEHIFLDRDNFEKFIDKRLMPDSSQYQDLKSKHFLSTQHLPETLELITAKYRSRKRFISNFTSLHMLVITLKCCNDCTYCQVSAEDDDAQGFDMTPAVARQVVDYIFKTPSPSIKIEFQGGEPTLNWETLSETVLYAKKVNQKHKKYLDFVVCTNLVKVDAKQLLFFKEHGIHISTSLDGPRDLHDKNRLLRSGGGTYDLFVENLHNARKILGHDQVNALMTTTVDNVNRLDEVIAEYVKLGFGGVFLRSLNPYGLASENADGLGYPVELFVDNFEKALDSIIQLNLDGTRFIEFYTNLLLTRILTPFSTGFVDLQSPTGAGISGAIYDYNGDVYPADEARMLARMGDNSLCMGNVFNDTYEDIFGGVLLRNIVNKSCVEVMPGCSSCVYRSYCGADPVRNYRETGDFIGRRPGNDFCKKNMLIFDMLFKKLQRNDPDEMDVFWSWVSCRDLAEVRGEL